MFLDMLLKCGLFFVGTMSCLRGSDHLVNWLLKHVQEAVGTSSCQRWSPSPCVLKDHTQTPSVAHLTPYSGISFALTVIEFSFGPEMGSGLECFDVERQEELLSKHRCFSVEFWV